MTKAEPSKGPSMFALGQKSEHCAVSFNESMPIGTGKNFIGPV